ncbi:hypothetical protein CDFC105_43421 [Clostridioides difficile]|nr:hypothetical protein CDFC105_43421 [Clostridioides difficile]CZT60606.1 hypothetical protein CDFC105_103466 [Clostridioides difficile]
MEKSKKLLIDTGDTLNKLRENNSEKLEKYIELLKEYYKQENKKERESFSSLSYFFSLSSSSRNTFAILNIFS